MANQPHPPSAEKRRAGVWPEAKHQPRKWWVWVLRSRWFLMAVVQVAYAIAKIARFVTDLLR
jgi:hypothetical protein